MARRRRSMDPLADAKQSFVDDLLELCRRHELVVATWDGSPLMIEQVDDEDDLDSIRDCLGMQMHD